MHSEKKRMRIGYGTALPISSTRAMTAFYFPSRERALTPAWSAKFDVTTKRFVPDGFTLPEAKSQSTWKDRNTLLVGTDFGKDSLTKSGYARITKEWKRGTPLGEAKLVFEGKVDDVLCSRELGSHAWILSGKSPRA